ncbi:MAG: TIGR03905 family TSCPD domain-containing protein, partial [Oscillospiraceae bacterium]|nr:TIGR03905 family TSCPD domain-containing protein [Oscillospiraceae bacterium]
EYTPKGVCARKIEITVNDGVLNDVKISGGCSGNGAGIAKLVEGMKTQDVIERLESIRCGGKPSSCPAQLAQALKAVE